MTCPQLDILEVIAKIYFATALIAVLMVGVLLLTQDQRPEDSPTCLENVK